MTGQQIAVRDAIGKPVRLYFRSVLSDLTVRWATVRELSADRTTLTVDDYHDAWGFGDVITHEHDGVTIQVSEIIRIEIDESKLYGVYRDGR